MAKEKKMTNREFFMAVQAGAVTEEVQAKAGELLMKLDEANAKRKEAPKKPTKASLENAPIVESILEFFDKSVANVFVAKDIAAAIGQSVQKTSAVLTLMANDGKVIKMVPDNRNKPIEYKKIERGDAYTLEEVVKHDGI